MPVGTNLRAGHFFKALLLVLSGAIAASTAQAQSATPKVIDLNGEWVRRPDFDRPNLPGTNGTVYRIAYTGRNNDKLKIDWIDAATKRAVAEMAPSTMCERTEEDPNKYFVQQAGEPSFVEALTDSTFMLNGVVWHKAGTLLPW